MFKNCRIVVATTATLLGAVSGVHALEATASTESTISLASPIDKIADQLSGAWMTTEPYKTILSEDGTSNDIFMAMGIAPITIQGMENTLYVESSLSDTTWAPFRQAVFQLYEYKGKVRLRTYTMAMSAETLGVYTGLHAAPSHFQNINKDQLIATLDIDLDISGSGFSGSTPYPYPTGVSGAVEMTSSITFDGTTLTTTDRGYDADGNIVWGDGEESSYSFEQVAPYAVATQRDDGLVIIDYPASTSDEVVADGDEMHVHYSGYLTDGTMFDSSYTRNSPFVFSFPPGNRAIPGWGMGMEELSKGAHRKLIIPGDLAYGPNGNPRANIPGDSILIFNVHLLHIDRPEPAKDTPVQMPAEVDSHEGHGHD
ncbi:MAG: FKBP-type peptidyl-prolyl cis-trans isomerase [Phycisphaerales bacterium]|nr:FKBP-type peptidyl-prolyl cis-trans isomerase [Phycisphaerales bacterium]